MGGWALFLLERADRTRRTSAVSHKGVAIPAVLASQFAAIATLGSFLVFGERVGRRQLAGAAVIVAGVGALAAVRG